MADTTGNDGRGEGRNAGALLLRDAGDVREGLRAWGEALEHGGAGAWSMGGLALAVLRGALAAARERGYPPPAGLFATAPGTATGSIPQDPSEAPTLAAVLQALTDTARAQTDLARALAAQRAPVVPPRLHGEPRQAVQGEPRQEVPPRARHPLAGESCPRCKAPVTLDSCVSCGAPSAVCLCDDVIARDAACETCATHTAARGAAKKVSPGPVTDDPATTDLRARLAAAVAGGVSQASLASAIPCARSSLQAWLKGGGIDAKRSDAIAAALSRLGH